MNPWQLVQLPCIIGARDSKPSPLYSLEPRKATDGRLEAFSRVYDIHNLSGQIEKRGGHRFPQGGKEAVLRCLNGMARVELHHPTKCGVLMLANPSEALIILADVWHQVELSPGAILLCCATTEFVPGDTVRDRLPCEHGDTCLL